MSLPEVHSSLSPAPVRKQNSIENAKRKIEVLDVDSESPTEADNIDTYPCSKKFKSSLTGDEIDGIIIMGRRLSDIDISLLPRMFLNLSLKILMD